jgi:hypothetical protein
MGLKPHAAAFALGLLALAPTIANAQDAPPAAEASQLLDGEARTYAANVVARMSEQFSEMMRDMGLDVGDIQLPLTPEMIAASIPEPSAGTAEDVGRLDINFEFDFADLSKGDPTENPGDYIVFDDAEDCRPPNGEVVYFRTMAVDDVVAHQCVVTVDEGGVWGLRSRSVAARGSLRVRSNYYLVVLVEGGREGRPREIGEGVAPGALAVSVALADYATAAAAVGRSDPADDPAELIRRLGRVLERVDTVVAAEAPAARN